MNKGKLMNIRTLKKHITEINGELLAVVYSKRRLSSKEMNKRFLQFNAQKGDWVINKTKNKIFRITYIDDKNNYLYYEIT